MRRGTELTADQSASGLVGAPIKSFQVEAFQKTLLDCFRVSSVCNIENNTDHVTGIYGEQEVFSVISTKQ